MKRAALRSLVFIGVSTLTLVACSTGGDDGDGGDGDGPGDPSSPGTGGSSAGMGGDSSGSGGEPSGSGGDVSGSGGSTENPDDIYAQARIDCVDRINGFRATEGKPPLLRWTEAEACSDEQSMNDAEGDGAHGNFGACDEFAQNTCPGWGSVEQVIQGCLQSMWDEGPGEPYSEHGHYLNMSSDSYTRVACGFYEMSGGDIWHNHNFK